MRRAWLVLMLAAGCDRVYGLGGRIEVDADLTPAPGDEDGDGTLDADDACPQIPNESKTDHDADGISVDCDPDDDDATTLFRWFPITAGVTEGLEADGMSTILDDGYELGDHDGLSSLVFDVDTGTVLVDVGYEIESNSVEDEQNYDWAEIGVLTVHRSFNPDNKERGDACFLGISEDVLQTPPVLQDAYLEMQEDDARKPVVTFAPPLDGTIGRFRQQRAPNRVSCSVVRIGKTTVSGTFPVNKLELTTGKVAIIAHRAVAKLTYVWIAWQP